MLRVRVFLKPYKQFSGASRSWDPAEPPTWPASTATLIECDNNAVLVDGLMTLTEGRELLAWVQASGKRLTTVYLTHGHADHFFGLVPVIDAFPDAQFVTHPEVAPEATAQVDAGHLAFWNSYFPGQLADHPKVPVALSGDELELEGHTLRSVYVGQSDVERSTALHIPELDTVVAGDIAYNRVHMWLAGSNPKTRAAWIESLNTLERLRPVTVIAGHKDPDAPDDDATRVLNESREYIQDFDAIVASSDSAPEIIAKMRAKYPDRGNLFTLTYAADSQRPPES